MKIAIKRTRKIVLFVLIILLVFGTAFFILSFLTIYKGVKTTCLKAQNKYKEGCLNSLIKYIQSDEYTIREKNSAVWALGQLADKRALPFLYELDKSLPEQEKCSHDKYLCKYEVKKAIKWCEKGNITNWMYRKSNYFKNYAY